MEQSVSGRKKVKIIISLTYDDSRAKVALWDDPQDSNNISHRPENKFFHCIPQDL